MALLLVEAFACNAHPHQHLRRALPKARELWIPWGKDTTDSTRQWPYASLFCAVSGSGNISRRDAACSRPSEELCWLCSAKPASAVFLHSCPAVPAGIQGSSHPFQVEAQPEGKRGRSNLRRALCRIQPINWAIYSSSQLQQPFREAPRRTRTCSALSSGHRFGWSAPGCRLGVHPVQRERATLGLY
ncbi:uncharacterized protein O9250_010292 isoform 2-T3 [Rhynochetos jubatus]